MAVPTDRPILVTGAAGFIGSHLCRRLVADGSEVVGLDDLSEGSPDNLRDVPEVRLVEADLRDEVAVADAARGCEAILHQAAKRSVPRSMKEPVLTTDVNVRGTLNVLLVAKAEGAVVVSASSSSVYGDQDSFPLREDMRPDPRSPYAASKLAAEGFCRAMWLASGVRSVSLRYFNVYGPGQDPASEYAAVVPRFVTACLTGARPVVHGDGEQARDFTFIDDVVDANLLALRAPEVAFGRSFNIGGGRTPVSVSLLLELIGEICDVKPDPIHEPPREGDVRLTHADVSSAHEILGFRPSVGIEEGLRRTVESFRSGRST
jgi:UDP-N-acetylglucosamine/UDP-N-acetyl-alpha-D-glucosaminouronate 4-epimerase